MKKKKSLIATLIFMVFLIVNVSLSQDIGEGKSATGPVGCKGAGVCRFDAGGPIFAYAPVK